MSIYIFHEEAVNKLKILLVLFLFLQVYICANVALAKFLLSRSQSLRQSTWHLYDNVVAAHNIVHFRTIYTNDKQEKIPAFLSTGIANVNASVNGNK